jgi:sec-independent protein translocase protein TatB
MFGIGTTEVIVILVVALLVIGPSKLPDAARALGKGLAEFRRMSSDVKKTLDMESRLSENGESKPSGQEAQTGKAGAAAEEPSPAGSEASAGSTEEAGDSGSQSPALEEEAELRPRLQPGSGERSGDRS